MLSLKRSDPLPLVVVVELESLSHLLPDRLLVLDAISSEMHRVKDLRIIACNPEITKLSFFHREAPLLVSLSLCDLSSGSLPIHPFQLRKAQLTKLELYDTIIAWNSPMLDGLTSLSISCVPIEYTASLPQILAVLRRSPSLQYLHLQEVFETTEFSLPSDIVDMAHLHTISLIYLSLAQPFHRHILLNYIRAPILRRVTVSHNLDLTLRVAHSDIFPRSIRPSVLPNVSGLRFTLPWDETIEMAIYAAESAALAPLDLFAISYTQIVPKSAEGPGVIGNGDPTPSNMLLSTIRTWSLSTSLRAVKVVVRNRIQMNFCLWDILKEMSALESLTFCGDEDGRKMGRNFDSDSDFAEICDCALVARRRLLELRFEKLNFDPRIWSFTITRLAGVLCKRENSTLKKIVFRSCFGLDINGVKNLRSYVSQIELQER